MNMIRTLLSNGLVQARVKAGIATASAFAGGWVMSHMLDWVEAHLVFVSHEDALALCGTAATFVAGAVLAGGTAIYNIIIDPANVNAKVIASGLAGDPAAANDKGVVAAVKEAAGTPEALAALQAKLSQGKV